MPISKEQYDEACARRKKLLKEKHKAVMKIEKLRHELFRIDAELSANRVILNWYERDQPSSKSEDADD